MCQRVVRHPLGLDAQLFRTLLQEMARQQRDVFRPFTQRRQTQADHVQAVEQVLAEQAVLDARFQVLVCGRNDAHVGLERVVAAHAIEVPI